MGAMGLLGSVMAGVGGKVVDAAMLEGKMLREERMRELDRQWRTEESAKDRTYRSEEAGKERDFKSGESEKERDFKSGESEAERELRIQLQGSSQGHSASEAEKSRTFQAEQADKARSQGLLTGAPIEDSEGKLWRTGSDGKLVPVTPGDGTQIRGKKTDLSDAAAVKGATDPMTGEFNTEKYIAIRRAQAQAEGERRTGGILPAPKDDKPAQVAPKGDTPPKGEMPPASAPDALWSSRVGGWVVKDPRSPSGWSRVKGSAPPAATEAPVYDTIGGP